MPFSDWLLVYFHTFSTIIALFASKVRIIVSSTSVQNLNRAALATFRTQIEQIWMHFEQSQIRLRTKWKIWTLFEPEHKNFKCLLKIEGSLRKFLNIKPLMSIPSPLKQYHFHAILIWWHSPFKVCDVEKHIMGHIFPTKKNLLQFRNQRYFNS